MIRVYLSLLFLVPFNIFAQGIEVASTLYFAGMELKLNEEARKIIKTDVDNITRNQKYFQMKVERAALYFPLIEKVFNEENFPLDFKYLALQESSLIPDAVSTSNAVGYWQFKKESAMEVGLRVDDEVDERMNIISSTRGAAKYLRKNNNVLNNWIYALLSYNLGLGGAKNVIDAKYIGADKMPLNGNTHWYVLRFLAHKIAYENYIGTVVSPSLVLVEFSKCNSKTLSEIAAENKINGEELEAYNKWVLKRRIPSDKTYVVILPVKVEQKENITNLLTENNQKEKSPISDPVPVVQESKKAKPVKSGKKQSPRVVSSGDSKVEVALLTTINGIPAIQARAGDTFVKLAGQGGITHNQILEYNDLKSFSQPVAGQQYFLAPKKSRAIVMFHTVTPGETLWDVSQKYGIRINEIKKKNRMKFKEEGLKPGRVLWLKRKRPKKIEIEYKSIPSPVRIDNENVKRKEADQPKESSQVTKTEEVIKTPEVRTETVITESVQKEVKEIVNVEQVEPNQKKIEEKINHLVVQGETLYSISRLYGVPVDSIRVWNGLVNNEIKMHQNLIVGKAGEKPDNKQPQVLLHKVQAGETMYSISKKYGIKIEDIQNWNGKTDNSVSVNEELKIFIR
ncbi:MAG: LysM peptidoglycan-binding domain-containing protein [Cytophagaceae bacterium]